MDKKGQLEILANPKTIAYMIGGALIGYLFFQDIKSTIIGGIVGGALSFIR